MTITEDTFSSPQKTVTVTTAASQDQIRPKTSRVTVLSLVMEGSCERCVSIEPRPPHRASHERICGHVMLRLVVPMQRYKPTGLLNLSRFLTLKVSRPLFLKTRFVTPRNDVSGSTCGRESITKDSTCDYAPTRISVMLYEPREVEGHK